jgi:hypothetical protein
MTASKCCWPSPEDWSQWSQWLAAGLHARNRWRLPVLLMGILFAHGRRTVTAWLRAAGVSADYQDYYYFLAALGRKTHAVATQLLLLVLRTVPLPNRLLAVLDDTPTKRCGPKVEGAGIIWLFCHLPLMSRASYLSFHLLPCGSTVRAFPVVTDSTRPGRFSPFGRVSRGPLRRRYYARC